MENIEVLWDNGEIVSTDWELSSDTELSLIEKIKLLPKRDWTINQLNQYQPHRRFDTACTWFSGWNAIWSNEWETLDYKTIETLDQQAQKDWRRPWRWWARGSWWNVARKVFNKMFPEKEIQTFVVNINSPEAKTYLETGRLMGVSINVDSRFWSQVFTKNKVDTTNFSQWGWHATVWKDEDWYKLFIDSVGRRGEQQGIPYTIEDKIIEIKQKELFTLRTDAHISLPVNIVSMITSDVPKNQRYSEAIEWMIKEWLTTEVDKFRPHDNMTRAEMSVFLKRFYDKFMDK